MGGNRNVRGDHPCRECDGTGWVLYRSETVDCEFEEAYRLCPKGHAPRYCMGSSSGPLCPLPATVRCGTGYYCEEHSAFIHDGREVDGPHGGHGGPYMGKIRQDGGEGEAIMSGPDDWIGEEVLVAVGSGRIRGILESFDYLGIVLRRTDEQGTQNHPVFYPMNTIGWVRQASEGTPDETPRS